MFPYNYVPIISYDMTWLWEIWTASLPFGDILTPGIGGPSRRKFRSTEAMICCLAVGIDIGRYWFIMGYMKNYLHLDLCLVMFFPSLSWLRLQIYFIPQKTASCEEKNMPPQLSAGHCGRHLWAQLFPVVRRQFREDDGCNLPFGHQTWKERWWFSRGVLTKMIRRYFWIGLLSKSIQILGILKRANSKIIL